MFNTMTLTKVVGAFCGMLLVFLLGNWVAGALYSSGGGHGDEHAQAYVIETGEEDAGHSEAEAPVEVDFATVYAAADAAAGEKEFKACKACHKVEAGANSTGPSLYGVVGRAVDSADGYSYSGALLQVAEVWEPEALNRFLTNPKEAAPGTKMAFKGIAKPEARANLIAWLDSLDD